jgi:broad specificity polyphosphatase/5'/3'-nucleotidase SurE
MHIETLSEGELDLVVGGIWDNPDQDRGNKNRADQNGKDGTVGGSIEGVFGGLVVQGSGPNTPGHPVENPF